MIRRSGEMPEPTVKVRMKESRVIMFTGIVEAVGVVKDICTQNELKRLQIYAPSIMSDLRVNDSVAVNGVCLTVVACDKESFSVQAVPETLRKTNLGLLQENNWVNLERPLLPTSRMGGHFVQGHIDDTAKILEILPEGAAWLVKFSVPKQLRRYLVNKGFVAIDGMSLTIIEVSEHEFNITLIPHTQQVTIAKNYQVGTVVNIEVDILAKYIEGMKS